MVACPVRAEVGADLELGASVTDLAVWLREQLDADERVAREASSDLRAWEVRGLDVYVVDGPPSLPPVARYAFGEVGNHIARWDPARVLAEVKAKRRIIDLYETQSTRQYENAMEEDRAWVLESAVRALTLPYADCPGYQPEWVPEHAKGARPVDPASGETG